MYLESVGLKNLRELYLHREQINCAIASLEEIEHCSAGQEAVGEQTRPLWSGSQTETLEFMRTQPAVNISDPHNSASPSLSEPRLKWSICSFAASGPKIQRSRKGWKMFERSAFP